PQRPTERHVARLRAAAREDEVAEPRKADQRFGPGAECFSEAAHLGKTARNERRMRAGAEALAVDNTGSDGENVLQGTTELNPDKVARPIETERRTTQALGEHATRCLIGARD